MRRWYPPLAGTAYERRKKLAQALGLPTPYQDQVIRRLVAGVLARQPGLVGAELRATMAALVQMHGWAAFKAHQAAVDWPEQIRAWREMTKATEDTTLYYH